MYQAIVFLPLIGAVIAGLFGTQLFRMMGKTTQMEHAPAHGGGHGHAQGHHDNDDHDDGHHTVYPTPWVAWLTTGLMCIVAVLAWVAFAGFLHGAHTDKIPLMRWIDSGALVADWSLRIDSLTAVMLVVVTTVSALVHLYSIGYMSHDANQPRFFAYLSFFTFAMLMLVTSDNLVQMFFGWEGVGLASYLLIGFWYQKPSANAAAVKAFVVNRVGDFGFALGIFGIFATFGTVEFDQIFAAIPGAAGTVTSFLGFQIDTLTVLGLLLFMGAMGKSAQFLLHTWLPDAMEGPTPVSALIHAATMVTAGVFLVARMSPLYEAAPHAREFIVLVGAITAFFAATVGLVQNDIKRIIAYSTCSQLGYMFVALGLGGYGIAMFHLFTHAFFKALLFLGAGSVIHAMGGEQDIRGMGGLSRRIPVTWAMMLIGTLSLTGFGIPGLFGFSGFYSKDAIIEAAWVSHMSTAPFAFAMVIIAALLTSFYSWRLMLVVFHGKSRATPAQLDAAHESPPTMMVPLYVLAVGAVAAGLAFYTYFVGHEEALFWAQSIYRSPENKLLEEMHHGVPALVAWAPTLMMLIGFGIAFWFYRVNRDLPHRLAQLLEPVYKFLLNKWYFDELYNFIFVRPARWLGQFLWRWVDGFLIDGLGPNGVAARVRDLSVRASALETGYLYHYAFVMLIGVVAIITWFSFRGVL